MLPLSDLGTSVGEAIERALAGGRARPAGLRLEYAEAVALALAETGSRSEKLRVLSAALARCSPVEGRYLARAILGEMRVGAKLGIVEDAIAIGRPLGDVRRAAALVGDVGDLAMLAAENRLAEARASRRALARGRVRSVIR